MGAASPEAKGNAAMWRGILWIGFALGAMLFISLKASNGETYYFIWGLIDRRLFIGAFTLLGLIEMTIGYGRGRTVSDPVERTRLKRTTVLCLAVLAIALVAGGAAWRHGAPYWNSIAALSKGDQAAARLKTIYERHLATMESGASGQAALASWKESALGALPLRPDFEAAENAARFLETAGTGPLTVSAGIDARFYAICLDWIDLYASISRTMAEESMLEPPEEWTTRQNALLDRIEALPPLPDNGS